MRQEKQNTLERNWPRIKRAAAVVGGVLLLAVSTELAENVFDWLDDHPTDQA